MRGIARSARPAIFDIKPYVPGKPIEEVQRELGLTDVIKLASNENPLGPSVRAMEALRAWIPEAHLYPDGGAVALKERIARTAGVGMENVIVGNGSDELIKLLAETFLSPGDEVIVADPTFSEYAFAAHLMGARVKTVPLVGERHDLAAMASAISPRTRLVFICNPNNPTGTIVSAAGVADFLGSVPEDVLVVFDQAYQEYVDDPEYGDGLPHVLAGRRAIVLRTFSKIYGLAGLRVGYGLASAELLELVERVREPFNVNRAAQVAAAAALDDQEFLERSRELNRRERARLAAALTARGLKVVPSQANFLFVEVGVDSVRLFRRMLSLGVIVRSGDIFGRPTFVRITVGTPEQNDRLLAALMEAREAVVGEEERS
ncbi:MAG TPA: histidinol-phosphate transaminase [Firmicutes bacterium]|nr:histidinol-phosphate transaminase [Bacillota bacterium]